MMKIDIRNASARVEMDYFRKGSVLKGTVDSRWTEARSFLKFESDAPRDRLALLVRNAKGSCHGESLVKYPVPLKSEVLVNGEELNWESEPES